MTIRTFTPWIAPLAEQMRASRRQVIEFARSAPPEIWDKRAPNDGWTNKDILAHIGRGNDQGVEQLLRAVIAGTRINTAMLMVDTDAANAEGVAARRARSVDELIVELEESGEEMQELLSQLTPEYEHLRQDDPPFILDGFLRLVQNENHDIEHLEQLRTALKVKA